MGKKKSQKDQVDIKFEPQTRKKFHPKDLINIQPLTENQRQFFCDWRETENAIFATGCAGTGKSLLSMFLALKDVFDKRYEKLVIIRGLATSSSVDLGALPGEKEEKLAEFEKPYISICDELISYKNSYENLKELGLIQFECISHLRGQTFSNAVILIDEVGGLTYHEIFTALTRVGENSRVIVAGDHKQNDLIHKRYIESGMDRLERVFAKMPNISTIKFDKNDIVRSGFVKELIIADDATP